MDREARLAEHLAERGIGAIITYRDRADAAEEVVGRHCLAGIRCENCLYQCGLFEKGQVEGVRVELITKAGEKLFVEGHEIASVILLPAIYKEHQYAPLWDNQRAVQQLLAAIRSIGQDGLNPADYNLAALEKRLAAVDQFGQFGQQRCEFALIEGDQDAIAQPLDRDRRTHGLLLR